MLKQLECLYCKHNFFRDNQSKDFPFYFTCPVCGSRNSALSKLELIDALKNTIDEKKDIK